MEKIALVVGSTGLIGNLLVRKLVEDNDFAQVITLARRESNWQHEKLVNMIVDFDKLTDHQEVKHADVAFCCLGTTMKKAGSKAAFYKVDYEYVLAFANYALQHGCKQFHLVSAMGANQKSMFYYNQVKGQIEEEIKKIGFESIHIMRPSLLLGDRKEKRLGEDVGKLFATAFSFLIPANYKGIQAESVANYMQQLSKDSLQGTFIHESAEIRAHGKR